MKAFQWLFAATTLGLWSAIIVIALSACTIHHHVPGETISANIPADATRNMPTAPYQVPAPYQAPAPQPVQDTSTADNQAAIGYLKYWGCRTGNEDVCSKLVKLADTCKEYATYWNSLSTAQRRQLDRKNAELNAFCQKMYTTRWEIFADL